MAMALGAIGAIASGVMGFAQSGYQAQVAEMNADIAKDNARRATQRGQIEQQQQDIEAANVLGEQVAEQSASGLTLASGSLVKSRRSARRLARLDALNVRQSAALEAHNYMVERANYKAQAQGSRMSGVGSLLGGFFQAGSSLIGGSKSSGIFA